MVSTPLNIARYVYKRGRSLERRKSIHENCVAYPDLSNVKSKDIYKYRVESFLRDCIDYKDALSLMETMYDDNQFDILESTVNYTINNIIPTVESSELPVCIVRIGESTIGDINKDRLTEAAANFKSIDRIIKNHKTITKRFRVDSLKGKSEKDRVHTVCEMVCTYGRPKYINFNIALEECAYIESINDFRTGPMDEATLVRYIADYFLEFDNNTDKDIQSYRKAIIESKILSNNASCLVPYLIDGAKKNGSWWDKLTEWKMDPNKSMKSIIELARENYSDIGAFGEIINTAKDFARINEMEFNIGTVFSEFNNPISRDQAKNILQVIKENNVKTSDDLMFSLRSIWEAEVNDDSYYADGNTVPQTFTSDDIDKFKMHNLITDAQDAGEFIDHAISTSSKESPVKITDGGVGDISKVSESNIIDYIDEEGYINIPLRHFSYNENSNPDIAYKIIESTAKCANNILANRNSKIYYAIEGCNFSYSLRSKYKVVLSESQENKRGFTNFDKKNILYINKCAEVAQEINESCIYEIIDNLKDNMNYAANVSVEEARLVADIIKPYIDKSILEEFIYNCRHEGNTKAEAIANTINESNTEFNIDADHNSRINLCARVMSMNEDANITPIVKKAASNIKKAVGIKSKDKDVDDSDDKKPSSVTKNIDDDKPKQSKAINDESDDLDDKDTKESKIDDDDDSEDGSYGKSVKSLNDAKLALRGLKAKGKDLSAKEQEASRDLDMEFNHLLKCIKSIYTTDHREEIITGEVNVSISKILKIAIALAGAGVASGTIAVPAIGAVALFALSKHASKKEKQAVLDQIDVELQVLDREISRAESSGSAKKYRQLLMIQKNLQRKRQQIHFGIAKSGKRIPISSTAGLRERE